MKPSRSRWKTRLQAFAPFLKGMLKGNPCAARSPLFQTSLTLQKKANPEKGDILEKGLEDLQKPGSNLKAKASALLEKLK